MTDMTIEDALKVALEHHRAGRLQQAENFYRQILQHEPKCVDALQLLGALAGQVGRFDVAEQLIRQAIAIRGEFPEALHNLANALQRQGRLTEAEPLYLRATELAPSYVDAHNNLGNVRFRLGNTLGAIAAYQQAIALEPDFFDAHVNIGNALQELGRYEEAAAHSQKAAALRPTEGRVWNNLGNVYDLAGLLDNAFVAYERSLALTPDHADTHGNYANALTHAGRVRDAIGHYRRALELNPSLAYAHSNLVYSMHFCAEFGPRELLEAHRDWNRRHAEPLARLPLPPRADRASGSTRLRIGFVSPDLRLHSVGRFLIPLFEHHDRGWFDFVIFSNTRNTDAMTERFRKSASAWHDTIGLDDAQLAELIRREGIDILIDLSLHMGKNRMLTFARKPAPVQATYLAYASTSGMPAMDVRFTDRFLDPPGSDEHYSERSVRLDSYWCYRPLGTEGPVSPLPALTNGHITFGCLNNFSKTSDDALATWRRILDAVPGARMILTSPVGSHRQRAVDALGAQRVEFAQMTSMERYIAQYHRVDLALDPFPYCGGTTTCDSMWMGVPVVTLAGNTAVGRAGVSILNQVGLTELIGFSAEEYIERAVQLANDLPRLEQLRSTLRDRMQASPLCDAAAFTRDFEEKLTWMWDQTRERVS